MKKVSQYNVFIDKSESVIIYNTLWDSFLVTNKHYADLLQKGCCNRVEYNNEKILNAFIEKKMVIEDTVNEIEFIRKTLTKTNNPSSYFELIINPTLACNFRCWYCYETHQNTSFIDSFGIEGIVSFVQEILSTKDIKRFVLKFFGGEPLLGYKNVIIPILSRIDNLSEEFGVILSVGITTNGYLLSRERLIFLYDHQVRDLQITIDGNRERHNKVRFTTQNNGSYDRIIQNIHDALSIGIRVSLRLNISEDTELNVRELLKDFDDLSLEKRNLLVFSVHKVWQEALSVYDIVEEIVYEIRSAGYKCVNYFSFPSSIWNTCYADKPNHLTINPGGKVYKCTACNFSEEHIEGILSSDGKITWNSLHDKRLRASALNIKACKDCPILPICIGGCSQRLVESKDLINCPLEMTLIQKQKYAYRVLSEKLERI